MFETVKILSQRWYILVLGLVLTATGCWVVQDRTPVTYEANGSIMLMPPTAAVGPDGNPYLYLGGMSQALDVLVRHVTVVQAVQPILERFPDTSYTVEADRSTTGSIMVISASGTTPDATLDVLRAAMETIPVTLRNMQDQLAIPEKSAITARTVVVDSQAIKKDESQIRLLILVAASGIAGTILLTSMLDGLLKARSANRDRGDGAEAAESRFHDPADERATGDGVVTLESEIQGSSQSGRQGRRDKTDASV